MVKKKMHVHRRSGDLCKGEFLLQIATDLVIRTNINQILSISFWIRNELFKSREDIFINLCNINIRLRQFNKFG